MFTWRLAGSGSGSGSVSDALSVSSQWKGSAGQQVWAERADRGHAGSAVVEREGRGALRLHRAGHRGWPCPDDLRPGLQGRGAEVIGACQHQPLDTHQSQQVRKTESAAEAFFLPCSVKGGLDWIRMSLCCCSPCDISPESSAYFWVDDSD